jgi:hypothetical protein
LHGVCIAFLEELKDYPSMGLMAMTSSGGAHYSGVGLRLSFDPIFRATGSVSDGQN